VIGNGILPSGKDTKFVLVTHVIASYLKGTASSGTAWCHSGFKRGLSGFVGVRFPRNGGDHKNGQFFH